MSRGGKREGAGRKPKDPSQVTDATSRKLANLRSYKPGAEWTGNAKGRPKGSRNKLGEDFVSALQHDFQQHGVGVIEKVRETKPAEYLKVIAGILPKEVNVNTRAVEEMSDDDLAAGIAALQSVLAAQAAREGGGEETKH